MADRQQVGTRLEELMALVLNVNSVVLADDSSALTVDGWDSLSQIALISAVEETYAVTFELDEMLQAQTVAVFRRLLAVKGVSA